MSDRGIEFGDRQCGEGLSAKPAMVAADSWRQAGRTRAATAANGFLMFVVSPASCVLRIARVSDRTRMQCRCGRLQAAQSERQLRF